MKWRFFAVGLVLMAVAIGFAVWAFMATRVDPARWLILSFFLSMMGGFGASSFIGSFVLKRPTITAGGGFAVWLTAFSLLIKYQPLPEPPVPPASVCAAPNLTPTERRVCNVRIDSLRSVWGTVQALYGFPHLAAEAVASAKSLATALENIPDDNLSWGWEVAKYDSAAWASMQAAYAMMFVQAPAHLQEARLPPPPFDEAQLVEAQHAIKLVDRTWESIERATELAIQGNRGAAKGVQFANDDLVPGRTRHVRAICSSILAFREGSEGTLDRAIAAIKDGELNGGVYWNRFPIDANEYPKWVHNKILATNVGGAP